MITLHFSSYIILTKLIEIINLSTIEIEKPQESVVGGIIVVILFGVLLTSVLYWYKKHLDKQSGPYRLIIHNLHNWNLNWKVKELPVKHKHPNSLSTPIMVIISMEDSPGVPMKHYNLPAELRTLRADVREAARLADEYENNAMDHYREAEHIQGLPANYPNRARFVSEAEEGYEWWNGSSWDQHCTLRKLESLYLLYNPNYRRHPTKQWEIDR
jgi:hypothetical protein